MAGKKKKAGKKKGERVGFLEAFRRRTRQRHKTTSNPTGENIDAYNRQPGGKRKKKAKKKTAKKKPRKR